MGAKVRVALLLLFLYFLPLNANYLFNDYLISPKAANVIEKIGNELYNKTKIKAYVIATHDKIERGVSIYDYVKKYENSLSKPYIAIVFAPNSKRIHVIASNKALLQGLDKRKILDYAINIIASKDKNSLQSKYDLGIVQAYSELADEIAKTKGVTLKNTIKESGRWVIKLLNFIVFGGALIVFWIYIIYPMIKKAKR